MHLVYLISTTVHGLLYDKESADLIAYSHRVYNHLWKDEFCTQFSIVTLFSSSIIQPVKLHYIAHTKSARDINLLNRLLV